MKRRTPKIPPPPPTLADSWLDGFCDKAALSFAVKTSQDELKAAGITETAARAIRDELQAVFDRWRTENAVKAPPPIREPLALLSRSPESYPFDSYADFFDELLETRYPPLAALSNRHGMALDAALMLAEAAAGHFESARTVRENMNWVLLTIERDRTKALIHVLKQALPAAEIGWKVRGGPKKRMAHGDKANFQRLAKPRVHMIASVRDLDEYGEFAFFRMTYKPRTLAAWLREQGATLSPGRPKKSAAK